MIWSIIILVFGGFGLKIYWDYCRTQSDISKAHIRDLEHRNHMIQNGINPDTLQAYGLDHSHDLCNANSPCKGCKKVQDKNMALNKAAWDKFQGRTS